MSRFCRQCSAPTEEAFDIPWLGKFFRCENGHSEVREPEGHRAVDDETNHCLHQLNSYVVKFSPPKRLLVPR
jgi:hypothetical protein